MNWSFLKNVWLYQLIANAVSIVFLIFWFKYGNPIGPFIIYCIIDPFIIRPYLDFQRLKTLGKIEDKDFRKMWKWGGLYRFKYYNSLMFGK